MDDLVRLEAVERGIKLEAIGRGLWICILLVLRMESV
jgi:hypothetical protein